MSPSQFTTPDYNFDAAKSRKSSSTGCLTVFGIIAVVCLLLCIGSAIFGYYYLRPFSRNPELIRAKTDEMLTIDIDESFEPEVYINFVILKMSFFKSEDSQNKLLFASMTADNLDNSDVRSKIETQIQSGDNELPTIATVESGERIFEIRGHPVEFKFNKAKNAETNEPYYSVTGIVDSDEADRKVLILLQVRQRDFTEAEIQTMLESIE